VSIHLLQHTHSNTYTGEHLQKNISQVYNNLDTSFTSFPSDDTSRDPDAYKAAIDALSPGDAITIFTPDTTHYPIAVYAIARGIHVLITKPAVQLLSHHLSLLALSRAANVIVYIEHHKRFDPAYADARHRALQTATLGDFNYFYSYMSQPKSQLQTFKAWAGRDSDISYYLNSHHVDVHESMLGAAWAPTRVTASASRGIAEALGCAPGTEDTITLLVDWAKKGKDHNSGSDGKKPELRGTAVYTSSWTAPQNAGLHSAQRFHYVASRGEIAVNQAKRGYEVTEDAAGLMNYNPFYMQYAPDERGDFAGQGGYGYVSFEKFVDAVREIKAGTATLEQVDARGIPTLANTVATSAILEAGRRSLDQGGKPIVITRTGEGAEGWALEG